MTDETVIDHDGVGSDLAVRDSSALAVAPVVTADDLVQRLSTIREAMQKAMQPNVDYGVIPGTQGKPTLLKPGAEKLGALFQLDVQIDNEKIWHDDGHLTVISRATVHHQPTGTRLGGGEGICTTREAKYAFRSGQWLCPACGKPTVLKSKQGKDEFFCWSKKGGCGKTFAKGTPEYETLAKTDTSQTPNPNLADSYNTVDKMASKRSRIDAVLAVTGASALFTQDVEADDGGAGAARTTVVAEQQPEASGEPKMSTKAQWQRIGIAKGKIPGLTDEQYRQATRDTYGVESAKDLTFEQAEDLIARLKEAAKQVEGATA